MVAAISASPLRSATPGVAAPILTDDSPSPRGDVDGPKVGSHAVPPPDSYLNVPIKMPHLTPQGPPPKLDTANFEIGRAHV